MANEEAIGGGTSAFWNSINAQPKEETTEEIINATTEEVQTEELLDDPIVNEEVVETEVTDTTNAPKTEEVEDEGVYFTTFLEDEEVEDTAKVTETPVETHKVKDKVKYNLKEYVDNNKSQLANYFKYADLDVDSMSNEELIRFKVAQDNPKWTKEMLDSELKEVYGIGLVKKVASDDAYPDEIDSVNTYNAGIDELINKGNRKLVSDVDKAKDSLLKLKEELNLPEVELDVELDTDPTKIIEEYTNQQIKNAQEYRDTTWIPNVKDAVSKVGGFKHKLEFEVQKGDKVVSELTYKLTDGQKEQLVDYLSSYQPHPTDDKYVIDQEKGLIDYQRFVSDKAKVLFVDDIIKASGKQLVAQYASKFIKEDIINFQDEPKRVTKGHETVKSFAQQAFARGAEFHRRGK